MIGIDNIRAEFRRNGTRAIRERAGELRVLLLYGLGLVLTLFVVWYRDPSSLF